MKKVLLCFLAALVTLVANADTLKVVPNDRITKEIAIDLAKYPFLTSDSYSWKHNGYDLGDTVKTVGTKTFVDVETAVKGVNDGFYYYEFTVNNVPVRDTVLYVHIYNKPKFTVTVNDSTNALISEGDTAKFKVTMNKSLLDLDSVIVTMDKDTLVTSTSDSLNYVPTKSGNLVVTVKNKFKTVTDSTLSITMIPSLRINSLSYSVHSSDDSYVKTSVSDEIDVKVYNHDSLRLVINSNAKDISDLTSPVIFAWNKDGIRLPEGVIAKSDTLVFPEFKKPEMDGKYHCMVSDYRSTLLVTFNVESEFPASTENVDNLTILVYKGLLTITNAQGKDVVVTDILGKVIHTKTITSYQEQFVVPTSTVLIVKIGNEVFKILSKC